MEICRRLPQFVYQTYSNIYTNAYTHTRTHTKICTTTRTTQDKLESLSGNTQTRPKTDRNANAQNAGETITANKARAAKRSQQQLKLPNSRVPLPLIFRTEAQPIRDTEIHKTRRWWIRRTI